MKPSKPVQQHGQQGQRPFFASKRDRLESVWSAHKSFSTVTMPVCNVVTATYRQPSFSLGEFRRLWPDANDRYIPCDIEDKQPDDCCNLPILWRSALASIEAF